MQKLKQTFFSNLIINLDGDSSDDESSDDDSGGQVGPWSEYTKISYCTMYKSHYKMNTMSSKWVENRFIFQVISNVKF